ncbi:MAG: TIGR02710 family CRISPR-associated CARF protein [Candidatus Rokuibacteriota bacterium]
MTILVLTVGGSHQPLLTAITALRPDRVVFLCSDDTPTGKGSWVQVVGEGKVVKSRPDLDRPDLLNIVTLADMKAGGYEVVKLKDLDNLEACYLGACAVLERLRRELPGARIIADYTGGTKSMTAGLAIAAVDDERCEINLVAGTRSNLQQVRDRTQVAQPVTVWDVRARRKLDEVESRVSRFEYAGAASLLESIALTPVSRELRQTIVSSIAICRGLDAWDRFAHAEARELLASYRGRMVRECVMLDDLCRQELRNPYVRVEDLLFNAERRAEQGRYDDAVARAYRALELIAQVRLRTQHGIDTSTIDLTRVPEHARDALARHREEDGAVRLALVAAWELLRLLGDDPLGSWFTRTKAEILGLLETRNHSILAHGGAPIDGAVYRSRGRRMIDLCREALALIRPPADGRPVVMQLPRSLPAGSSGQGGAGDDGATRVSLKPADAAAVAEFAEKVRAALGSDVVDMRLFGSKATGRDTPDSDIDILVVVQEARTDVEDRILAIAFDVNLAHDVYISPRVVGRATLDDPVWKLTSFLQAVAREGISL